MEKLLSLHYCLHQLIYFGASAGIISFAATFLLGKGFPASQVSILLASFHSMTENYLISIVGRLGGNSSHVGTALFIATISAAPVLGLTIRKIDRYRLEHPV